MSDYDDYKLWFKGVGLALVPDDELDEKSVVANFTTTADDPDPTLVRTPDLRTQESAHGDEIPFEVDEPLPFDATATEDQVEHVWVETDDTGEPEYLRRFRCRNCHKTEVLPPDWTPGMLDKWGCW